MAEQTTFLPTSKAWLPNSNGCVTLHDCVRLEVRKVDRECAIVPIFQCPETLVERIYGCLAPDTTTAELAKLFPGVELERLDDHESVGSLVDDDRGLAA